MFARVVSAVALLAVLVGCGPEETQTTTPSVKEPVSDLSFLEPENVPDGVALRLNPKADVAYSYTLKGVITVSEVPGKRSVPKDALGESTMTMDFTVRVAHADAGSVTLGFESSPLELEGKAKGVGEQVGGQKGEVRLDRRAALLSDPSSLFEGLFSIGMLLFPENKIGPGSTWFSENTRDMPPFGPVLMTERFVYRGTETKGGEELHRIGSTATGTLEGMETESTYWIRKDGLPHSTALDVSASAPIAQTSDGVPLWAAIRVKVELLPK